MWPQQIYKRLDVLANYFTGLIGDSADPKKQSDTIEDISRGYEHRGNHDIDNHDHGIQLGLEWTRAADYLSTDGRDYWGHMLCLARLDRFDFWNILQEFMFDYT
jgi:hypothetical protein